MFARSPTFATPQFGMPLLLSDHLLLPHDPLVQRDAGWSHRRMVAQRPACHPRPLVTCRASPARP